MDIITKLRKLRGHIRINSRTVYLLLAVMLFCGLLQAATSWGAPDVTTAAPASGTAMSPSFSIEDADGTGAIQVTFINRYTHVPISLTLTVTWDNRAGGQPPSEITFELVRYLSDGSLDTAFGSHVITLSPANATVREISPGIWEWSLTIDEVDGLKILAYEAPGKPYTYRVTATTVLPQGYDNPGPVSAEAAGDPLLVQLAIRYVYTAPGDEPTATPTSPIVSPTATPTRPPPVGPTVEPTPGPTPTATASAAPTPTRAVIILPRPTVNWLGPVNTIIGDEMLPKVGLFTLNMGDCPE